jgi:HD-GYP domain-containing protein (c-di-GMP phosphodiesterase class II)
MSAALESPPLEAARPSADLDPEINRFVADARNWCFRPRSVRERLPGILLGGAFLAFSLGLLLWFPAVRAPSLYVYAVFIAAYAIASRAEFQVGPGFTVPTQIIFVPMLFVLPLRTVPLCVAAALLIGDTVAGRGRLHVERVPLRLANAWYAAGPVLVLGAAGAPSPALRHAPVFALALAAQIGFDFVSASSLEWFRVGLSPRTLARFMAWAYVVDIALAVPALSFSSSAAQRPLALFLTLPLIGLLAFFARERRVRIDHAIELSNAYRGTALLLGDVVEADDEYTGGHSRDVVGLVLTVCDKLGLDARERRDAEFAALLHDVGKVRVPSEIINKTGPLDDEEREIMKRHTIDGELMLDRVGGLLGDVGRVVRSSHEHWDGSGYPDALVGEAIPLGARIVAACDAFSAMTTDRSYREALSQEAALAELRACAGSQFDPRVVEALCEVAAAAPRAL